MQPSLLKLRVSTRVCTTCVPALKCLTGVHMAVASSLSTARLALVSTQYKTDLLRSEAIVGLTDQFFDTLLMP
jgi:hypothetical protein